MPIFRLLPSPLEHDDWPTDAYKGEMLVRAADEPAARQLATSRFPKGGEVTGWHTKIFAPWENSRLVTCTREEDSGYPEEGPDAVLLPGDTAGMVLTPEEQS